MLVSYGTIPEGERPGPGSGVCSERRCCQVEDGLRDWPVDPITDSSDELIDLTLHACFELLAAEKLLLMCLHYARIPAFRIRFIKARELYQ